MAQVTQPLRDEHRELLPLLEQLKVAADSVEPHREPAEFIARAHEFLTGHLLVHAGAEEAALYPEVARLMGSESATKTMEVDHAEVARLTAELGRLRAGLSAQSLTPERARELRAVLYGLYTLVKVHFKKEEEVYLPLLDARMPEEEARAMFARMEQSAAEARKAK